MDLLLWRHAEALDGVPDADRPLTDRGRHQARHMADWLANNQPPGLRVLASPTLRTRMTAEALTDDYHIDERIGTGASATDIDAASCWPNASASARVGSFRHAPLCMMPR